MLLIFDDILNVTKRSCFCCLPGRKFLHFQFSRCLTRKTLFFVHINVSLFVWLLGSVEWTISGVSREIGRRVSDDQDRSVGSGDKGASGVVDMTPSVAPALGVDENVSTATLHVILTFDDIESRQSQEYRPVR